MLALLCFLFTIYSTFEYQLTTVDKYVDFNGKPCNKSTETEQINLNYTPNESHSINSIENFDKRSTSGWLKNGTDKIDKDTTKDSENFLLSLESLANSNFTVNGTIDANNSRSNSRGEFKSLDVNRVDTKKGNSSCRPVSRI